MAQLVKEPAGKQRRMGDPSFWSDEGESRLGYSMRPDKKIPRIRDSVELYKSHQSPFHQSSRVTLIRDDDSTDEESQDSLYSSREDEEALSDEVHQLMDQLEVRRPNNDIDRTALEPIPEASENLPQGSYIPTLTSSS